MLGINKEVSDGSDIEEEVEDKDKNFDMDKNEFDLDIEMKQKSVDNTTLEAIIRSKVILSFGYFHYLHYYFKISIYHCIRFTCCCCCKVKKHTSMIARKYERNKNAG